MHILIVDDLPEFKVHYAIEYLKSQKVEFTYEIAKSYRSAVRYIGDHIEEIDLAIIDLGLPIFDDEGGRYNPLEGLNIVYIILEKKISIPIIINSTTQIPKEEEYLKEYTERGANIKKVDYLDGKWLREILKQL